MYLFNWLKQKKQPAPETFWSRLLGYEPTDMQLYELSMTHSSANYQSNERLEYLGDSIIGSVVADVLYHLYPTESEGFLTRSRSKVVCREHLNSIAHELQLPQQMHFGQNMKSNTENIYGNALEALVGAIYLDKGYAAAAEFINRYIVVSSDNIRTLIKREQDFKSRLLEYCQAKRIKCEFELIDQKYFAKRDQHIFTYEVRLDGKAISQADGSNKHNAQQNAAEKALKAVS